MPPSPGCRSKSPASPVNRRGAPDVLTTERQRPGVPMPEVIILPALFATMGFVVWTIASSWQRSRHVREMTQLHARIIDRMGSIKDFNDFLQTRGGREFMNALTADKGPTGPRERILRAVQTGIVLASVAVGCLL